MGIPRDLSVRRASLPASPTRTLAQKQCWPSGLALSAYVRALFAHMRNLQMLAFFILLALFYLASIFFGLRICSSMKKVRKN
jgi:hypothetical protein